VSLTLPSKNVELNSGFSLKSQVVKLSDFWYELRKGWTSIINYSRTNTPVSLLLLKHLYKLDKRPSCVSQVSTSYSLLIHKSQPYIPRYHYRSSTPLAWNPYTQVLPFQESTPHLYLDNTPSRYSQHLSLQPWCDLGCLRMSRKSCSRCLMWPRQRVRRW